jgi:hypothetical protein
VVPGRVGAALTKPGRVSTARWCGFGERDGEEYVRNRRCYVLIVAEFDLLRCPLFGDVLGTATAIRRDDLDVFSSSLITTVFSQRGMRWFGVSPQGDSEGRKSFIFHAAPHSARYLNALRSAELNQGRRWPPPSG